MAEIADVKAQMAALVTEIAVCWEDYRDPAFAEIRKELLQTIAHKEARCTELLKRLSYLEAPISIPAGI